MIAALTAYAWVKLQANPAASMTPNVMTRIRAPNKPVSITHANISSTLRLAMTKTYALRRTIVTVPENAQAIFSPVMMGAYAPWICVTQKMESAKPPLRKMKLHAKTAIPAQQMTPVRKANARAPATFASV
jgi:hypothetical protein